MIHHSKLNTMNLVTELNKIATENAKALINDSEKVLETVKLHLNQDANADTEMLKHFGTSEVMNEGLNKKKSAEEMIAGKYLTQQDIASVCYKYALRYLPTKQYVKEIPVRALNDLRLFTEKMGSGFKPENLRIIAPASHFKLGPRPQKDPVLIYQHSIDKCEIISQWGSDFNWERRVIGFANRWGGFVVFVTLFITSCIFWFFVPKTMDDEMINLYGFMMSLIVSAAISSRLAPARYNQNHK